MTLGSSIATADERIADAIDQLREELAVGRQVLDEICSELQWANRNRGESSGAVGHTDCTTSTTRGPVDPDQSARFKQRPIVEMPAERLTSPGQERGSQF